MSEAHYRLGMAYDRIGEREKAKTELALHRSWIQKQKDRGGTAASGDQAVSGGAGLSAGA